MSIFLLASYVTWRINKDLNLQTKLARIDSLTGAYNAYYFSELLKQRLSDKKLATRPLTLVYFDLDNFKQVNDFYGHSTGNEALQTVVRVLQINLRRQDAIGRMGGDEFAILLFSCDQQQAQQILPRLQEELLAEMARHSWPITFSIGVFTCMPLTASPDALIKQADELMYTIKQGRKNGVVYGPAVPELN